VVVTVANISARSPTDFNYITLALPPTIVDVSPLSGPVAGGVPVLVQGTGFAGEATVLFTERSGAGAAVAVVECEWRGIPAMYCTESVVR
jgi:hypothetical protein